MSENLRPEVGTVTREEKGLFKTVITSVVETDRKLTVYSRTYYDPEYVSKEKANSAKHNWDWYPTDHNSAVVRQKFLCVGGELEGQYRVEEEAPGYLRFNKATRWHTDGVPKSVLVRVPKDA
jgi:hypothetical protein